MMRILLPVLLLTCQVFMAQNITYNYSEDYKFIKANRYFGLFKIDTTFSKISFTKGQGLFFQNFNEALTKVKNEQTVELPGNCLEAKNAVFHQIKSDFYCFYSTQENNNGKLFVLPFNKSKFGFDGKEKQLLEVENLGRGMFYGEFEYINSPDSSKLLVRYYKALSKGVDIYSSKLVFGYALFDRDFNKLYASEIEIPYLAKDLKDEVRTFVDSKGDIFALLTVKLNNSIDGMDVTKNEDYIRYELMKINKKTNSYEKMNIESDKIYIYRPVISENRDGQVVLTGVYTNVDPLHKWDTRTANGTYILNLNSPNKLMYHEFPNDVLQSYTDQKNKDAMIRDNDVEMPNLQFKKAVFNEDGTTLLIAEAATDFMGNGIRTETANDIMVTKLDKNYQLLWCRKIPKLQRDRSLSFYYHHMKNSDYFFYYDDPQNLELKTTESPHLYGHGAKADLIAVKIDANGDVTKQSVFKINTKEEEVSPKLFRSVNEQLILVNIPVKKDNCRFLKIEVK